MQHSRFNGEQFIDTLISGAVASTLAICIQVIDLAEIMFRSIQASNGPWRDLVNRISQRRLAMLEQNIVGILAIFWPFDLPALSFTDTSSKLFRKCIAGTIPVTSDDDLVCLFKDVIGRPDIGKLPIL